MAGAKPGVHALQLKPVVVHEELKKGSKFVRWEEDSNNPLPILGTLKVDQEGFFLIWSGSAMTETEILDINTIKDTRKGKYARAPKDPKIREKLCYTKEEHESKLLTIVHGQDLVNVSFICLLGLTEENTQIWTDELFSLATNIIGQNASRNTHLNKAYYKLKIQVGGDGKIPVKCFMKLFSDKKRVEVALEQCGLLSNKSEGIKPEDFTWDSFQKFLDSLCFRPELHSIFEECGARRKPFISLDQFTDFINGKMRDSRLNEVLYPPLKRDQVRQIMEKYETNSGQLERDQISLQGFSRFLAGEENNIIPLERLDLYDDMTQPLPHYFINSSHNTYLTVGQLTGMSSVEMYRQVLLTGCRCIELDCWKGRPPDEEPYITHGFTMTTEISFKEVIEAIAESAFKASPYPLILSFENHVDSPKQQAKMAEYCRTIFGDALLIDTLDRYPLIRNHPLPSPQDLLGKILIKNKKKPQPEKATIRRKEPTLDQQSPSRGEGESEEEEEDETPPEEKKPADEEGTALNEVSATEEMSNLVNYIQPVKFKSFEVSTRRRRFFEMSSFVETKAIEALKTHPFEFLEYNKFQLSRIYPKGTRVDSSNYMPQLFWNIGCQMVALNFQTPDLPMQLNMGVFEYNGHTGYLLKPEFMRRPDKHFDPFTESIVDGIVANTVTIKVISGQFLSERKVGVYVEIDLFGIPSDTKRKYRTKTSNGNSMDPMWDDETFVFYKVILPSLASLRVAVFEENGRLIGHRILPISALKRGYRYINLKNEFNQPLMLPSLLVYTEAKDYIPNEHQNYADALTNPIKHIGDLSGRELQLAVLLEDKKEENEETKKETDGIPLDSLPSPELPLSPNPFDECPDFPKLPAPVVEQTPKEDMVAAVLTEISYQSLEDLRQHKSYTKLKKKQMKDFSELRKKNQKKIQSESQKRRTMIDKNFKRSIKKGDMQDGIQRDLDKQKTQLWEQQMHELLALRQELHAQEKQMQHQHLVEEHQKLKQTLIEYQDLQLRKFKDICEKEKKDLQKKLEKKRLDNVNEIRNQEKRVSVDEFTKKHISESVDTLRRLEKAQEMRQEKFLMRNKEMLLQMDSLLPQLQSQLDLKLEEEYRRLPEEIRQHQRCDQQNKGASNNSPFSAVSNHSSPSSNCSTPYDQRSLNKSMDNTKVSRTSSTSSCTTPGLSEAEVSFN
ncbi:1-phosphatidylinositol 4,5-bisphosphate phosphodiesterase beta-3 [Anableps anableps]